MTDKPVESGNPAVGNEGASPSPEFQTPDSVQQTSQTPSSDNLRDTVKQVLSEMGLNNLDERIERGIQSTKDRRFSQLDQIGGRVDELETSIGRYNQLRQAGQSHDDAMWRMRTEQFMSQQQQATPGQADPQFGKPQDWWVKAQSNLLKSAGVPENDPGVAEFARSKKFANAEAYMAELYSYLGQRLAGGQASGALNMGTQNATPLGSGNIDTLRAAYRERLAKIPRGQVKMMTDLRAEFRKLGYDPASDEKA